MGIRLFWRIAFAFVIFWIFAFGFFGFLGWLAATRFGGAAPYPRPFPPPFGALVILLIIVGLLAALRSLRQTAVPVRGLMEVAGQLAEGRYGVRIKESGPPEARALARAFNQVAERLQTHEQQRRDLLADVTHELRTPLAVIQGNLEGVLDGIYPADEAHLAPILDEARVLAALVEDLRTLTLAETGSLELHREPTDLSALVDDTIAAFRPPADAAGVTLFAEGLEDLPSLDLDATRIREVLANLLSNALQHTPSGGSVRVTTDLTHTQDQADAVTIAVMDTGSGIAPEALPHIFDRFYKSKESRGMGLGLAIARNLIVLQGGDIQAESAPGKGTTIRFWLPVKNP